jgi:hypothetical protein
LLVKTGNISGAASGITTGFKTSGPGKALAGILEPLSGVPIIGVITSAIGSGVIKSLFGTKTSIVGSGLFGGSAVPVFHPGRRLRPADLCRHPEEEEIPRHHDRHERYSTQYGGAIRRLRRSSG